MLVIYLNYIFFLLFIHDFRIFIQLAGRINIDGYSIRLLILGLVLLCDGGCCGFLGVWGRVGVGGCGGWVFIGWRGVWNRIFRFCRNIRWVCMSLCRSLFSRTCAILLFLFLEHSSIKMHWPVQMTETFNFEWYRKDT